MGVLYSKPLKLTFQLVAAYLTQIYINPVKTKSISSCISAYLGCYISQLITYGKLKNHNSLFAFAVFGLLFGGSVPHYFFNILSQYLSENSSSPLLQLFLVERLVFMPTFSFFSLYVLSRLQGKSHEQSFDRTAVMFTKIVEANWKYLTVLQYINIYFVPPILKVLISDIIGFFWIIFLSCKMNQKNKSNVKE